MERKKIIKKLDELFSKRIRSIGHCERCGKTSNLQCSHIISRKCIGLRWNSDNAVCLCVACHLYWWHKEPLEAAIWVRELKGNEVIDRLMKLKQISSKISTSNLKLLLIQMNDLR